MKITDELPRDSAAVEFYFAFPDGVYHYVCGECTALCCHNGFGGSLGREMKTLVQLYPALESLAYAKRGDILTFVTPSDGCFFLDHDNMCRIEKEHGQALKPGVCLLFPFNAFARIGSVLAVQPHFICPLRLQIPPRPGQVAGTHAQLVAAIHESGLMDRDYINAHMPSLELPVGETAAAVVRRETQFRDACAAALGARSFGTVLNEAAADPAALQAFIARASGIMGLAFTTDPRRDEVDDLLLGLAAPLRMALLKLPAEGILRALALGALVLRRAATLAGQRPLTLQGAYEILMRVAPALRLLAHGDEPLALARRAKLQPLPFGDANLTFASFAVFRAASAGLGVLTMLERALPPTLSVADRSVVLIQLGTQLEQASLRSSSKALALRGRNEAASRI